MDLRDKVRATFWRERIARYQPSDLDLHRFVAKTEISAVAVLTEEDLQDVFRIARGNPEAVFAVLGALVAANLSRFFSPGRFPLSYLRAPAPDAPECHHYFLDVVLDETVDLKTLIEQLLTDYATASTYLGYADEAGLFGGRPLFGFCYDDLNPSWPAGAGPAFAITLARKGSGFELSVRSAFSFSNGKALEVFLLEQAALIKNIRTLLQVPVGLIDWMGFDASAAEGALRGVRSGDDDQFDLLEQLNTAILMNPEAAAITAGGRLYTYRDLYAAAAAVAHRLVDGYQAASGTRIGIRTSNHFLKIASLIGILKAGADFVLLEDEPMPGRLGTILDECNPQLILTDESPDAGVPVEQWVISSEALTQTPVQPLPHILCPPTGRTGILCGTDETNAGIVVSWQKLNQGVHRIMMESGVNEADTFAYQASLPFCTVMCQVLATLCEGGQVVVRGEAPEGVRLPARGPHQATAAPVAEGYDYWQRLFPDGIPPLDFPVNKHHIATPSGVRPSLRVSLAGDDLRRLLDVVDRHNVRPEAVLLTALNVLCYKYTGQQEIVVALESGSPGGGQGGDRLPALLKTEVRPEAYLSELFAATQENVVAALAHAGAPFERFLAGLASGNPGAMAAPARLRAVFTDAGRGTGNGDPGDEAGAGTPNDLLAFVFHLAGTDALRVTLHYQADLFTDAYAADILANLTTLLRNLGTADVRVKDVPVLSGESRQKILAFSQGEMTSDAPRAIIAVFEENVRKFPHRVAVHSPEGHLTYANLNVAAEQCAACLAANYPVEPSTPIGVLLQTNDAFMISVLAILKLGCSYLPFHLETPVGRVDAICRDAGVKLLITQDAGAFGPAGYRVIPFGELREQARAFAAEPDRAHGAAAAHQPFYTIYTSGSTGTPKGITITNDKFLNELNWYVPFVQLREDARNLLIAPVSFDLLQKDIFGTLVGGGMLVLVKDPKNYLFLKEHIRLLRVTHLNCAPSAFYPFLFDDTDGFRALASLREVIFGGEPIKLSLLTLWTNSPACQARLINSYGPTECTDTVSAYVLDPKADATEIPIGRPLPNVEMLVLDKDLNIVPMHAQGELYLGGLCVSDGYLNNAELTRQKFIHHPYRPGSRLYATGDLCRLREDGNFLFNGRNDFQIKIRGYRVEVQEIEAHLSKHPLVQNTAVLLRRTDGINDYLFCFYSSAAPIEDRALKAFIGESLPAFMVPSVYRRLEEFPLLPSGKIDRHTLERLMDEPGNSRPAAPSEAAGRETRQVLEALLTDRYASIMALSAGDVLRLGGLGIDRTAARMVVVNGLPFTQHHVRVLKALNPAVAVFHEPGSVEELGFPLVAVEDAGGPAGFSRELAPGAGVVLNAYGKVLPPGFVGHVHTPDGGLFDGFVNRPEQTRKRLVKVAFGGTDYTLVRTSRLGVATDQGLIRLAAPDDDFAGAPETMPNGTSPDAAPGNTIVPPATETEEAVLATWREVLGNNVHGVTDDFFDLGGHSISAIQVISRINQRLSIALEIGDIFSHSTVRALAQHIDAISWLSQSTDGTGDYYIE